MSSVPNYGRDLGDTVADSWNRFWFTPVSTSVIGLLRIGIGICALIYLIGYSFDLVHWFGANGMFSLETLRAISLGGDSTFYRLSWFYLTDSPTVIWCLHFLGLAFVLAMTIGFQTRYSTPLALLAVLSYVHRGPLLSGQVEPVLCMGIFYLGVAYLRMKPAQRSLSLDAWLASRKSSDQPGFVAHCKDIVANVGLRLFQIHLVGFYALMLLTQLSGETWWLGEAIWTLIASTESRWVDLTEWARSSLLLNAWTFEILLFELAFAVLIWVRVFRPVLIVISIFHWTALILLTGLFEFGLAMMIANAAFVSPEWLHSRLPKRNSSTTEASAASA